ncbi:hypothetical protein BIWAKO_01442 [Bosea sp. BIWAKO-01]|nr:hypothetical protein BIWAKO_01442 [Bosea sp. BIWAKO-01]
MQGMRHGEVSVGWSLGGVMLVPEQAMPGERQRGGRSP